MAEFDGFVAEGGLEDAGDGVVAAVMCLRPSRAAGHAGPSIEGGNACLGMQPGVHAPGGIREASGASRAGK